MDSSGFSSPRPDCLPAGLRVLVVDDDPIWLKILEKMLKKCHYEVTTCNLAREALDLLCGRKDGYDIVITDVNIPNMDGFMLLELVGLEMDIPVIVMSVDGEISRVMKGVHHGACDYLLKPIRMKELRNIWQHVFRKRIHEGRDIEGHESLEELQMMRSASELSDDGYFGGGDLLPGKNRKDVDSKNDDRVCGDSSSSKKARVVWTVDLHQKFVKAVNLIGFEKVGPKKILDLMGVPWLTRENVASHLQKYRLYLSRLEKENEIKATHGGRRLLIILTYFSHALKIQSFLMDSSGFSLPQPDCFPAGLRVLVVDDDPTWLKILEKMLKKCHYEVTTCNLAREALDLLRGRKDGYDIVITDVNIPNMDGFMLLELVGLEMDVPVIVMSVNGETSRVMKCVQLGACDYILKPIRMKELRNIWQHVFRKRIHEVRDIEVRESLEELQMMRSASELSDDGHFFGLKSRL